ncbi:MAG: SDR family NAD(P)-dependent oxidoreductase [Alphaproteobacteria bacterium]|nr:SDR family NAD(P)-dependent oxidoreductase [Alphaproteobacteria bacterium]
MNKNDFGGKLALITGSSRGIGRAVAKALAGAGAHVILLSRTQGALEELDDEIRAAGGISTLIPMDLRKQGEIEKLGPSIAERFGRLDILIGNTGTLGPLSPSHQIPPKDWQKVMDVNFMANILLVSTLDPLLRAAPAGRIVFSTTLDTNKGTAYWAPYMASKAALNSFIRIYAAETVQTNLRINGIDPGVVNTALLEKAFPGGYPGKVRTPEDVTGLYLHLAHADCASHGQIIPMS